MGWLEVNDGIGPEGGSLSKVTAKEHAELVSLMVFDNMSEAPIFRNMEFFRT